MGEQLQLGQRPWASRRRRPGGRPRPARPPSRRRRGWRGRRPSGCPPAGGHHRPVGAPDHHHAGHRRSPGVGQNSSRRPVRPRRGIPFPGEGQAGWAPCPTRASVSPATIAATPTPVMDPLGDGSQRWNRRSRVAGPRPVMRTSTWREWRRPWPWPRPCQVLAVTARRRSAGSDQGPRGRGPRRARGPWRRGGGPGGREPGRGRTSTTSTASRRAATTVVQALGPGAGTRARRSRAMPVSAAATIPRSGRPTAATQEPAAEAPATRARARAAERLTVTVVPRRSPWPGSSGWRAGTTGSSRSSARVVPGPTSSARAEAPELLRVVLRPPPVAAMALCSNICSRVSSTPGAHGQRRALASDHSAAAGTTVPAPSR